MFFSGALSCNVKAQLIDNNLELIKENPFTVKQLPRSKATYLFKDKKNVIVKYNPVSLAFGGMLLFYQRVVSAQLSTNCPYDVSCSNFAKRSIQQLGFLKGVFLSADRLTRCTQFTLIDLTDSYYNEQGRIKDPLNWYLRHHHHE
jgi:putative component of membrane protein insertase Oxa1/YidC/SpoIIIJ protein YidD